jgi:hypothetical protein
MKEGEDQLNEISRLVIAGMVLTVLTGCAFRGAGLAPQVYPVPKEEAEWIVKGWPIDFEGQLWYPRDFVDLLLDSEVTPAGEYKDVQFFVEKIDVRPYDRLYTKFGFNKFRVFTKNHDKSKKGL